MDKGPGPAIHSFLICPSLFLVLRLRFTPRSKTKDDLTCSNDGRFLCGRRTAPSLVPKQRRVLFPFWRRKPPIAGVKQKPIFNNWNYCSAQYLWFECGSTSQSQGNARMALALLVQIGAFRRETIADVVIVPVAQRSPLNAFRSPS